MPRQRELKPKARTKTRPPRRKGGAAETPRRVRRTQALGTGARKLALAAPPACPRCARPGDEALSFCAHCGEDVRGLSPTSETMSGSMTGRIVEGRYRLLHKLGEGGMGTVYKCEHVRLGKVLALKILRPDASVDRKVRSRFVQEARVVARLSSPHTIQVFDFGELSDGAVFIAMEYLPGRDLASTLRSHGALSEERAAALGAQVLASLAEAHAHHIIHRDIKPANVMLLRRPDGEDQVKVLDFGIAKLLAGDNRRHLTGGDEFIGTPAYMSPEQARGEALDARSDLYAVGALLFELVAGRPPFVGKTPVALLAQHMNETAAPRLSAVAGKHVSTPFEEVVTRALSKQREQRFASADQMRQALESARRTARPQTIDLTPVSEQAAAMMASRADFERLRRRRRTWLWAFPVGAALALSGWAAVLALQAPAPHSVPARALEVEPNDTLGRATLLRLGHPLGGTLAPPSAGSGPDQDVFVVDLAQPTALTVEVGGLPGLNLVVELLQAERGPPRLRRLVTLDDLGEGGGERLDGIVAGPGRVFVRLLERAHPTEEARPPRDSGERTYALRVLATDPGVRLELEPNDGWELATSVDLWRSVTGYTGAVPPPALPRELPASSHDFFALAPPRSDPEVVAALVLPGPGVQLEALDAADHAEWLAGRAAGVAPPAPEPQQVRGEVWLLPLRRGRDGRFGLRLSPTGQTAPGSPYRVAFIAEAPGGFAGALELARSLKAEGRGPLAAAVLKAAAEQLPTSPHLTALQSALASVEAPGSP